MLLQRGGAYMCFAPAATILRASMVLPSGVRDYLEYERDALVGAVDSHELLKSDNDSGLLPTCLKRDANALQLAFVDETLCIGCRLCADVARSTFRMEDEYGAARAYQQCGDDQDTIAEAINCCPVDCIHAVSFNELCILEQHRRRMMESGEMAAAQGVGKLSARAEGRDGARGSTWRAPLRGMGYDSTALDAPEADAATAEGVADGAAVEVGEAWTYYVVERLLDASGSDGERMYLVKWEGYTDEESTWESAADLPETMVAAFEAGASQEAQEARELSAGVLASLYPESNAEWEYNL